MNPAANSTQRPITESPWYWAYLFCTGGLIAMVLIGPKYAQRQTHIEQNGQKRQWAARLAAGQAAGASSTQREAQSIPLWPLFVLLGSVLSVAWLKLIRDHFRGRTAAVETPEAGGDRDEGGDAGAPSRSAVGGPG